MSYQLSVLLEAAFLLSLSLVTDEALLNYCVGTVGLRTPIFNFELAVALVRLTDTGLLILELTPVVVGFDLTTKGLDAEPLSSESILISSRP